MGEAKIFLYLCKTNVLHPVIRIEITDSDNIFVMAHISES